MPHKLFGQTLPDPNDTKVIRHHRYTCKLTTWNRRVSEKERDEWQVMGFSVIVTKKRAGDSIHYAVWIRPKRGGR